MTPSSPSILHPMDVEARLGWTFAIVAEHRVRLVRAGNVIEAIETAFPVIITGPKVVQASRLGQPLQTYFWKPPRNGTWEMKR